jgi:glycine/D-amino acid oxidase-like deaminating enzyme
MTNRSADIIIIGAGIMGLCTAWQLSRRSKLKILVLEKGKSLGEGSTGASSAVCRHRYSINEMMELARDGINAYRDWGAFMELSSPLASFHNDGVLWIDEGTTGWATREQQRMQAMQINAEVLDHDDVAKRFPAMSACRIKPDLELGSPHECKSSDQFLFESDGGYFDPADALADLAAALRTAGVEVRLDTAVTSIQTESGKSTGVVLANGSQLSSGCVINASGPWCNHILEPLGLESKWPLRPTRIQVIHIDRPDAVIGKIPVCCDLVGGIYFREQNRGQQIVVGSTLEEDEREVVDPSRYNDWVDDDFKAAKLHALKHRIPALPGNISISGYTGLYTVNQEDVHPVVGATEIEGFYVANGFSGHGFKVGPAIGSLLAREITGDTIDFDTSVSSEFLAFNRSPLSVDSKNVLA